MEVTSFASCPYGATDSRAEPVRQLTVISGVKKGEIGFEAGSDLSQMLGQPERCGAIDRRGDDAFGGTQAQLAQRKREDQWKPDRGRRARVEVGRQGDGN